MTINCPLCKIKMEPRQGECKYGTHVKIDQCQKCGGLWADPKEFHRINPEEAKKLIEIDEEKFKKEIPPHKELNCPRCSSELDETKDYSLPNDVDLQTCSKCKGIWITAGSFLQYKKWRVKKSKSKDIQETPKELQKLNEQIEELLLIENHKEIERAKMAGKIGRFLKKHVTASNDWKDLKDHEKRWLTFIKIAVIIFIFIVLMFISSKI